MIQSTNAPSVQRLKFANYASRSSTIHNMSFWCDRHLIEIGNQQLEKMHRSKTPTTNVLWLSCRRENWVPKIMNFFCLSNKNSLVCWCINFWQHNLKRPISRLKATSSFRRYIAAFVKWKYRIGRQVFSWNNATTMFTRLVFKIFLEQKMSALFVNKRFF
jgi:hypothetical protein